MPLPLARVLPLLAALLAVAACSSSPDAPPPAQPGASPAAAPASTTDDGGAVTTNAHAAYERLRLARDRYREVAEAGGWPTITQADLPADDLLEPGDTAAVVLKLRERLAATGDLDGAARDRVFDGALLDALVRFQRRHGLTVDSLVGGGTLAALNVTAAERVAQIEANLARWDALPDTLGARYLVVNVPEYRLRAYEGDDEVLQMNVVVGAEYDERRTPLFNDTLQTVVFRPYWNVPPGIAADEIVPQALAEPGYFHAQNFQLVRDYDADADTLEVTRARLRAAAAGDLRVRQGPGPENSLGLVKFLFPNQHAVYLHDSPAEQLFDDTARAYSHGCIRVARPADLAEWVLSQNGGWDAARVERALSEGDRREVEVAAPIPVYIFYWTAFADDSGAVQFRPDVYDEIEA